MEVISDTMAIDNEIPEQDIQKLAAFNNDLGDLLNALDDRVYAESRSITVSAGTGGKVAAPD